MVNDPICEWGHLFLASKTEATGSLRSYFYSSILDVASGEQPDNHKNDNCDVGYKRNQTILHY